MPVDVKECLTSEDCVKEGVYVNDNFKAKIDVYSPSNKIVIDWKTCAYFEANKIAKVMYEQGHYLQAVHYRKAIGIDDLKFIFVYVQKKAPYEVRCFRMWSDAWEVGEHQWESAYEAYQECHKSEVWPNANNNEVLDAPIVNWATVGDEDEDYDLEEVG